MPPKKKEEKGPPTLIGRLGTQLKIGIVGLPNVGKSTFFNVLTKSQIPAENYPFCTVDPNESRVPVPDERYEFLCDHHKPASRVPAFLNVVDIAGLVKGAHEGQGLGNAFLSHIHGCDAVFHMTRAFEDADVTHVEGEVDPIRDMEIIHEELRKKDEEHITKRLAESEKKCLRGGDRSMKPELDSLKKIKETLSEECQPIRFRRDWSAHDIEILNKHLLLTSKPMIYLINLTKKDYIRKKNKWLMKIKEWISANDPYALVIPFSAGLEMELMDMGGPDEVRAWPVQKGAKAPNAAGKVHSDMEKGFIMAEVMKYSDFKEEGSEANCKSAGKYRQQGRNYVVEDGDIMLFKFNAGAGLTAGKKK